MNKREYYVLNLISIELVGQLKINSFWRSCSVQSCEVPKVKGSILLTGVVKSWLHVYLVVSAPGTTTGGSSTACPGRLEESHWPTILSAPALTLQCLRVSCFNWGLNWPAAGKRLGACKAPLTQSVLCVDGSRQLNWADFMLVATLPPLNGSREQK